MMAAPIVGDDRRMDEQCCGCFPIKCGFMALGVMSWLGVFGYLGAVTAINGIAQAAMAHV